jgi:hypothetical protein
MSIQKPAAVRAKLLSLWEQPRFFLGLVLTLIAAFSLIRASYFPETDVLWGARNGEELVKNGFNVYIADTWNLTTLGRVWSPNSWLWNVVLFFFYHAFGTVGFVILTAIANFLTYLFIFLTTKKFRIPATWQFLILIVSWIILTAYMNGRSNAADILILTGFVYLSSFLRFKKPVITVSLILISSFVVQVLWLNIHLTAILGVVLLPAITFILQNGRTFLNKAGLAVASLIGTASAMPVSPFGLEGLAKTLQTRNESVNFFVEWSNVFYTGEPNWPVIIMLLIGTGLGIYLFVKKQYLVAVVFGVFIYESYTAIRFAPYLLILALAGLAYIKQWSQPKWFSLLKVTAIVISVIIVIVGLSVGTRAIVNPNSTVPVNPSLFQEIPQNAHVATTWRSSAELILYRPDTKIIIDGRNDFIGKKKYKEANDVFAQTSTSYIQNWFTKYDIDTVFVPDASLPEYENIIKQMKKLGWSEHYYKQSVTFVEVSR